MTNDKRDQPGAYRKGLDRLPDQEQLRSDLEELDAALFAEHAPIVGVMADWLQADRGPDSIPGLRMWQAACAATRARIADSLRGRLAAALAAGARPGLATHFGAVINHIERAEYYGPPERPSIDADDQRELARGMRKVAEIVYQIFFASGAGGWAHGFIEVNGIIQKYVDLCQRAAEQGIDFTHANIHGGGALPMEVHDAKYLGDKIACMFLPSLQANPEAFAAFKRELGIDG